MAQAVPIVECFEDSRDTYKLNYGELETVLKDVKDKKVMVISIAGAFRKGKSFLLNFFVTYLEWLSEAGKGDWFDQNTTLDKFHFRGGKERDTNGIYMWSKPYLFRDADGEEVAVLLMDTQGTFDHRSTVQDCATIFALSTLLSSVQIFNVSGQIQEDDLNNLRLFTEYAQLAGDQEKKATFQRLLFLVRDWPNSDENDYGFEGGQEYLDDLLKTSPKQKKELRELRQNIKSSFEHLEAFLMPHPGPKIAKNNSQKVLGNQVEEDFLDQLEVLVPSFFSDDMFVAKTINGKGITCGELLLLFKSYMAIFNSDDLPKPQTILNATAEAVNVAAEQKARKEYEDLMAKEMKKHPSLTCLTTLTDLQRKAENAAMVVFEARPKLGEESLSKANRDNLKKHFQTRHADFKKVVEQNEERERERQRIKAEEERLRQEKVEQERVHKEQEEALKRKREEQEKQRREEEARIRLEEEERQRRYRAEEDRMRREREQQERLRREQEEALKRQREEQERQRREQEARYRREEEERQRRIREDEARMRQQMEELERRREMQAQAEQAAARQREEQARQMQRMMMEAQRASYYSPSSYSYGGGGYSSSSSSGSSLRSGVRAEQYTTSTGNTFTRYRGSNGRFVSRDNAFD